MKKIISSILIAASLLAMLAAGVSAASFKNDKAVVFNSDGLTEKANGQYNTTGAEKSVLELYTWGSGAMTYADNAIVLTTGAGGKNMFEGVIVDPNWHFDLDYKFLKIRYKSNKAIADGTVGYNLPSNLSTGKFKLTLDGQWHETIVDMTKIEWTKINWKEYVDDYAKSASLGKKLMRSFRIDFPVVDGAVYTVDYIGYFKTEADAKAFDGTEASLAKKPAPTTAPATADPMTLALVAAAASMAGVVVSKKRK